MRGLIVAALLLTGLGCSEEPPEEETPEWLRDDPEPGGEARGERHLDDEGTRADDRYAPRWAIDSNGESVRVDVRREPGRTPHPDPESRAVIRPRSAVAEERAAARELSDDEEEEAAE